MWVLPFRYEDFKGQQYIKLFRIFAELFLTFSTWGVCLESSYVAGWCADAISPQDPDLNVDIRILSFCK